MFNKATHMKKFTEFEKEILFKIVNNKNYVPNFIDRFLEGIRVSIDKDINSVTYLLDIENLQEFKPVEAEWIPLKIQEINSVILTTIALLEYLEKTELINVSFPIEYENNKLVFGRGVSTKNGKENKDFISYQLSDKSLILKFIRFCFHTVTPTQDLIFYVTSGFKTLEEINFEREEKKQNKNNEISLKNIDATNENIRLSRINNTTAIIVAFISVISLLVTIFFNIFGNVTLNNSQLNKLLDKFNNIDHSIDSLNTRTDTIQAHIFSMDDSVNTKILNPPTTNRPVIKIENKISPEILKKK